MIVMESGIIKALLKTEKLGLRILRGRANADVSDINKNTPLRLLADFLLPFAHCLNLLAPSIYLPLSETLFDA